MNKTRAISRCESVFSLAAIKSTYAESHCPNGGQWNARTPARRRNRSDQGSYFLRDWQSTDLKFDRYSSPIVLIENGPNNQRRRKDGKTDVGRHQGEELESGGK